MQIAHRQVQQATAERGWVARHPVGTNRRTIGTRWLAVGGRRHVGEHVDRRGVFRGTTAAAPSGAAAPRAEPATATARAVGLSALPSRAEQDLELALAEGRGDLVLDHLHTRLVAHRSLFESNQAIGHDANNDDASKCSAINNGQHEIGSGGNGGALYNDGNSVNTTLCGDAILDSAAGSNAFGGGLFFTSNDFGGTLAVVDTTMTGNAGGHWTSVSGGSVTNAGTAVGTNAKSITITNSTLQGVP
jgi:hypothetical protein